MSLREKLIDRFLRAKYAAEKAEEPPPQNELTVFFRGGGRVGWTFTPSPGAPAPYDPSAPWAEFLSWYGSDAAEQPSFTMRAGSSLTVMRRENISHVVVNH